MGIAIQCKVEYKPDAVFVNVPYVWSLTLPDMVTEVAPDSCLTSPGAVKEFAAGWTDPGKISFEYKYDPEVWADLEAVRGEKIQWRTKGINSVEGQVLATGILVKNAKPTYTAEDNTIPKAQVEVQLSGPWVFSEEASV